LAVEKLHLRRQQSIEVLRALAARCPFWDQLGSAQLVGGFILLKFTPF
jgi:hypothetical protein